jgi:transposase-like protein
MNKAGCIGPSTGAIDRDGNLVDTMLSEHRDMAAAQAFFRSAKAATGVRGC